MAESAAPPNELLKLILSLGIDSTIFIQLGSFLVTYLVLYFVVFKPFFKAYEERQSRTVGSEDLASQVREETLKLENEFAELAKKSSEQHKEIFELSRKEAVEEQNKVLAAAKERANTVILQHRTELASQAETAREGLLNEVPAVSQAIASQLLGKEVSQ